MDRVIARLIELLSANLTGRGILQYYNGHPMKIPNASLPSIIVRGTSMESVTLDTQRNQETYKIEVILIHDARAVMNTEDNENTIERVVRKTFEERGTNNETMSNTIMNVVENVFMYDSAYNLNVRIDRIRFGAGLDPVFSTEFPSGFYGIAELTVTARPHRIRTP